MFVGHALDAELAERPAGLLAAPRPRSPTAVCTITLASSESKLGLVRVAGVAERVDAHAGPGRRLERGERAADRAGPSRRAIVSMFTRTWTAKPRGAAHGLLRQAEVGQGRAAGQLELGLHEVDAGDLLGDGVLDLEPRVGLDEDVSAAPSASTRNSNVPRLRSATARASRTAASSSALARAGAEVRRRRDLDQLLVAALQAALALPEVGRPRRCRRRRSAPRRGGRRRRSCST